jgi:DNA-binding transcriptional MerR regulator
MYTDINEGLRRRDFMKMKEVCKLTNLTERTIRYYIERQLIAPEIEIINGREYRNYSDRDVEQLLLIAELRKIFFSIDSIIEMFNEPSEIRNILKQHQKDLFEETNKKQEIIEALEKIETAVISNAGDLVKRLQYVSVKYDLPECDIKPNFGKFDSETNEEKVVLSERAWNSIVRSESRKRKKIIGVTSFIIGLIICSMIGFKVYSYENRSIYNTCFIPSITFTKTYMNESNEMIGEFHIIKYGSEEIINKTIITKFQKDYIGDVLFRCILTNTEYASGRLEISMSIKEAKKLDVLIDEDTFKLNIIKILEDDNLSKKYTTITYLQGDYQASK